MHVLNIKLYGTISNKEKVSPIIEDSMQEINTPKDRNFIENPDYIFIDDDKNLCNAWKLKANFSKKTILCFNTVKEFENIMEYISRNTPIYIDSELGNNELGEYASKKLYDAGFHTIFLATGKYNMGIIKPEWIKAVVHKAPPF